MTSSPNLIASQRYSPGLSRIVVCGFGSMGAQYLDLINKYWPSVSLGVLRSGKGNAEYTRGYSINSFFSINEAIKWNPQLAIIATPASTHLNLALSFARRQIPLLIEKPVGVPEDLDDQWRELGKLSREIPVSIGYLLRLEPCAHFVRKKLMDDLLGPIVEVDCYCGSWLPSWRPNQDYRGTVSASAEKGGGVLMELSHELDLAYYLFGNYNIYSSYISNTQLLEINAEDLAYITAVHDSGFVINFRLNFCTSPPRRYIVIRTTKSEIKWDLLSKTVIVESLNSESVLFASDLTREDRLRIQVENMISCINGTEAPTCSLQDALFTLKLIDKAFSLCK